jgi:hypothetical protein
MIKDAHRKRIQLQRPWEGTIMLSRRSWVRGLTTAAVALLVVAAPILADELIGTVQSTNVDAKSFLVMPKGGGDDVEVKINDKTEFETAKGKKLTNFDLAKMKKGTRVTVTHEKGVASKVVLSRGTPKKKEADKSSGR